MKKSIRQLNNNTIALLIGLNIFISILVLISLQSPKVDNIAYASTIEDVETSRKGNEEIDSEENVKEDILFKIEAVTSESSDVNTIPLYFSHADEHGAYFTYLETEQPKSWEQGYWYIDYGTLKDANISSVQLQHNDEIQGVFYATADNSDYFEIKEVIASN